MTAADTPLLLIEIWGQLTGLQGWDWWDSELYFNDRFAGDHHHQLLTVFTASPCSAHRNIHHHFYVFNLQRLDCHWLVLSHLPC